MSFKKPIRLFWGENYTPKPQILLDAIERGAKKSNDIINLYPGSLYSDTTNLIAKTFTVNQEQITLTHGIEGAVHLIADTFLGKGKTGGMFSPSFFVYGYYIKRSDNFVQYPVTLNEKIDLEDFVKQIQNCDVFFHASPNTSTGNYVLDLDEIEYVLKNYKGLFIVDECYFGLGDITVLPLLKKYKNLVIINGLSKVMGMPALRFGYVLADISVIKKLRYNLNDVEFDPIDTYALNIFIESFPYNMEMAKTTKKFFDEFLMFMQSQFPNDTFIKNITTFHFMDISKYKVQTYKVMNHLTKNGYLMSENELRDDSNIDFPEYLEFGVPPREYWEDFAKTLKSSLK
jgi:histidinol-phosphate/aromatic aminotransferase/cobyric acid decarboxylase-like protein